MLKTKTIQIGNSIMLLIPSELHLSANKDYVIQKTRNSSLIFSPKITNPYKSNQNYVPAEDNKIFENESKKELH